MDVADPNLPQFLQRRVGFLDHSVSQDAQAGFNMGIRLREQSRIERAAKLQEEAMRLTLEEKQRAAEGTVAISRVLSKMGSSGGYTDPALRAEFWDEVSRNPHFARSPVFKDIMDSFQNADQAKERGLLERQRQESITERNQASIDSRFGLLTQRIDAAMQAEGIKQEHREALAELKADLQVWRDSMKPTRAGELVHDLSESDLSAMKSELATLDNLFKAKQIKGTKKPGAFSSGYIETPDAEYQRRKREVIDSYSNKRLVAPKQAEALPTVTSKEDFDKLQSGDEFIGSDGKKYRKP